MIVGAVQVFFIFIVILLFQSLLMLMAISVLNVVRELTFPNMVRIPQNSSVWEANSSNCRNVPR
jgi:hypothetical protein